MIDSKCGQLFADRKSCPYTSVKLLFHEYWRHAAAVVGVLHFATVYEVAAMSISRHVSLSMRFSALYLTFALMS
jgi:hypothetical protein